MSEDINFRSANLSDKKLSDYSVFSWSDDSFFSSVKSITVTALTSIHEISIRSGGKVYLVPEEFYKQAIKK